MAKIKNIYEGFGYYFDVLGLRSIQIIIKACIDCFIDLLPNLKNSKAILNIRNSKYNCLQLNVTDWLHPAMNHATRESTFVNNLIETRQQHEDYIAYIMRIQKLYNINILVYTPCGERKVELFKPVDDFDKDRKDVIILVWGNGLTEHCVLIKNIEHLIETTE